MTVLTIVIVVIITTASQENLISISCKPVIIDVSCQLVYEILFGYHKTALPKKGINSKSKNSVLTLWVLWKRGLKVTMKITLHFIHFHMTKTKKE